MKMISLLLLIIFFMVLLVLNTLVFAEGGGEEDVISYTIERTASTDTTCNIVGNKKTCTKILYSGTMNYLDNGVYVPIETDVLSSSDPNFDYEVTKGVYQAYFKDDPTQGQVVKYVKDDVEVTFQPMALNYRNDLNQLEPIDMINAVTGTSNENEFIYKDAYGSGIDLKYTYHQEVLKEGLIIDSFATLPSPEQYILDGGNPTLDLDFVLSTNSNHIVIEGFDWNKQTTTQTQNEVYIKDDEGNILYKLAKPYAYDDNGDSFLLTYEFKKSGNSLYVILKTDYSWLQSTVYPVVIDPSIVLQDADTENLNDAHVQRASPTENFGSQASITISFNDGRRIYIMFDNPTSSIPSANMTSSILALYTTSADEPVQVHYINSTWDEENIIWDNQPCGNTQAVLDSTKCNTTFEDNISIVSGWNFWNVTESVKRAINESSNNISLVLKDFRNVPESSIFKSKESISTTLRPYLNITYIINIPQVTLNSPVTDSALLFKDKPYIFNFSVLSTPDILNATLWWNVSNVWQQNITNSSLIDSISLGTFEANITANLTRGYFAWNIEVCTVNGDCDFADDNFTISISNSIPTVASATINNSNPIDANDIGCDNGSVSDLDTEDTVTLHYDWYNSSDGTTFVSYGLDTKTLDSTNLTSGVYWKCVIFPTDSFGDNGENKTSATIQVGSNNIAPVINFINLTTEETSVISNTTNPTNNDSYVRVSINWSDANDDDVKVLACTTDSATINGCSVGTWWNSSLNLSVKPIAFNITKANLTTRGENNIYVFLVDDDTTDGFLLSASKLGTFEVNFPPISVNFSKTTSPNDDTSFAQTFVNLSWTATSDPDSDSLRYFVYTNTSTSSYIGRGNTTSTRFDLTSLSDATYNWKIETLDEHNYSNQDNSSSRSFTISVAGAAPPAGGGGGVLIIIEENVTVITEICNFNNRCEPPEDFLNCPSDCEFTIAQINPICIFIPKENVPCIYRTGIFIKLTVLLAIISSLILLSDTIQGRKIRAYIKEKTKFDFKF